MIQDLEQIEYRRGMLDKGMKPRGPARENLARDQDSRGRAQGARRGEPAQSRRHLR